MADTSKFALRTARRADIESHAGDMLDDNFRHHFDWPEYHQVIASSDSDAYNSLVCAELGPEMGYHKVLQVAPDTRSGMTVPRSGTLFRQPFDIYELQSRILEGWVFSATRITEQFAFSDFRKNLEDGEVPFAVVREDASFEIFSSVRAPTVAQGDQIVSFVRADTAEERKAKRQTKAESAAASSS
jgi:hypothetical protein